MGYIIDTEGEVLPGDITEWGRQFVLITKDKRAERLVYEDVVEYGNSRYYIYDNTMRTEDGERVHYVEGHLLC